LFVIMGIINYNELVNVYYFVAIILCFFGDFFLGFENKNKEKKFLPFGLVSFLLAHVMFVYACKDVVVYQTVYLLYPILSTVFAVVFFKKVFDSKKSYIYGVVIYNFVVNCFLLCSILTYGKFNNNLLIGGVLFWLSDMLLSFVYFKKNTPKIVRILSTLAYFSGMFFLVNL
ncbi:MAG: lysoplasmalogenase family protein, partial [Erysipelotrichaceae bacterium]